MKNILALILAVVATSAIAQTSIQYVDVSTPHTNAISSSGSKMTVFGVFTNASYTTTNAASVSYGDPMATAFSKINNNFYFISNTIARTNLNLGSRIFWLELYSVTNHSTNAVLGGTFTGDGTGLAINGTHIAAGTISSNAIDADTWYAMTNGAAVSGGTMNFDSGNVTSDGGGNVTATTIKAGLRDNGYSDGTAGYIPKANGDGSWTWANNSTMSFDVGAVYSDGSGNVTATTIRAGLRDSGYSDGTYGYSPVANGDGTWSWMAMVTITNTITVTNYVFTNQVFQSKRILAYSTNSAMWAASNYLARVPGLANYSFNAGDDGGNPPQSIPVELRGSYNGTNGWFVITNNTTSRFHTSNAITIVAITTGTSQRGGTIHTPGACQLFTMDDWRFYGLTNKLDNQFIGSDVAATFGWQFINKDYADSLFANAFNGNFSRVTDTNGNIHVSYTYENFPVMDLIGRLQFIPIASFVPSGWSQYAIDPGSGLPLMTPTNAVLSVALTNLVDGWTLQSSTNLALLVGFYNYTNYTTATNGANLDITISITPLTSPCRYFRMISGVSVAASITPALQLPNGLVLTTPATITTSSNTTYGFGAGLMLADTNYIYVSVGTNRWKRAALTSW